MYIKNKLGIYVYDEYTMYIDKIYYSVNSISYTQNNKFRVINDIMFGIHLSKYKRIDLSNIEF